MFQLDATASFAPPPVSWSAEQYTYQNNLHPTCQPPTRQNIGHFPNKLLVDLHVSLLVQHHIISVLCDHCQLYDLLNQLLVDLLDHLGDLLVNYPIHHHLKLDLFYLREVKFH